MMVREIEAMTAAVTVSLDGKVVLITGGGHGLGRTLAYRYASAGADVVVVGRATGPLTETADGIRQSGRRAEWLEADVSRPGDVTRAFERAVAVFGTVNILVNNAAITGPTAEIGDIKLDEWNEVLAVNLTGPFLCSKAAIPIMRKAGGGKIVNIGSVTGKRPLADRTPYASSKLGLVGFTRTLAQEVGKYGINVNLVSPFLVRGPRLDLVIGRMATRRGVPAEVVRAEMTQQSPFGRGVTEDDVANVVLFLSSSAADNMTGQDINMSAGAVMY
jgi:NAD(P)-dependent dehydrogenase (short-subunit alcohol dehydrogenase family)